MTNPVMLSDTYRKIATRLTMFRPQIDLTKYFAGPNPDVRLYDEKPYIRDQLKKYGVAAATNTLDGITFLAKDWESLITTLRIAKTADGFDAFAEGNSPEKPAHWALDLSMAATIGRVFARSGARSYRRGRSRRATSRAGTASGLDAIAGSGATTIAHNSARTRNRWTSPRCTSPWLATG